MGSIKVLIIAVVATLTPLLALASESDGASNLDPQRQEVVCTDKKVIAPAPNGKDDEASETVTVSVPDSTVNFVCPEKYTFDPPVPPVAEGEKVPEVYNDIPCKQMEPLTNYCPGAKLEAFETGNERGKKTGAKLTVPKLPADRTAVFYVQCIPLKAGLLAKGDNGEAQAACVVQVTVNQAGVHICKKPGITVNLPDKDSSVKFSCEKSFNLYPTDPAKVFKDDCKTEEPLKDMTRTAPAAAAALGPAGAASPSAGAAAPTVYTLKAVKKPPKKKLCYLCATHEPTDTAPKPPENSCAIYVESSARARPFGLGFTPMDLILSSVLAMLRLM